MLRAQLITARRIFRLHERTRVLDPTSAYAAIEEAYGDLENDLIRAAGIHIDQPDEE